MAHRNETEDSWKENRRMELIVVNTNAEQRLYKPSIVQCMFLGHWKFQNGARSDSPMQWQGHVWSSPFSPSVSTLDPFTINFQANKHQSLLTLPHPVRPSARQCTGQKPCSALYIFCKLLTTDSRVKDHPLPKYLSIWPLVRKLVSSLVPSYSIRSRYLICLRTV